MFKDRTITQNSVVREVKVKTKTNQEEEVFFEDVVVREKLVHVLSESQTESVDKSKKAIDSMT